MNLPKIQPHEVKAELCRRSFYYFVQEFWDTVIHEKPVWNWHIEYLCSELQTIAERVKRREPCEYQYYLINIPPGSSKSTIVSQMYIAWTWTIDPTQRFICGSYSQTISRKDASFTQNILNSDKYRLYFSHINLEKDAVDLVKNNKGGERFATSVGGSVTGQHGHQLILDDPLNPQQSSSEAERKTANEWISTTLPTRKVDKLVVPTIIVMQRLHENDPCGYLMDKGVNYKHICLPAELDSSVRPLSIAKNYVNGLLDPIRLSTEILNITKKNLGSYGYAGQFQQKPAPAEGGLIKKHWFKIIDASSVPSGHSYFNADTAYTDDEKNDPTGIMSFIISRNDLYITNFEKGHWEFMDSLKELMRFVKENGYSHNSIIEIEPKACFVKGTMIRTKKGLKPIERIKKGDIVLSFNEKTKEPEWQKVVNKSLKNEYKVRHKMITFIIEKEKIKCTHDHLFYIEGNWVTADRIAKRKMDLYPRYREQIHCIEQRENTIIQKSKTKIYKILYKIRGICIKQRLETLELDLDKIDNVIVSYDSDELFDIEVENNHNFCVGNNNIIAHNSGKSVVQTLKSQTNLNVKEAKNPTKDKTARVNDIISFIEAGRVYLVRGGWNDDFIDQCALFPNAKHDEEVDCLVMACNRAFTKSKVIRVG